MAFIQFENFKVVVNYNCEVANQSVILTKSFKKGISEGQEVGVMPLGTECPAYTQCWKQRLICPMNVFDPLP